jgi:hypothetical protein
VEWPPSQPSYMNGAQERDVISSIDAERHATRHLTFVHLPRFSFSTCIAPS